MKMFEVFSHLPEDMTSKYSTAAHLMNKVGNFVCVLLKDFLAIKLANCI